MEKEKLGEIREKTEEARIGKRLFSATCAMEFVTYTMDLLDYIESLTTPTDPRAGLRRCEVGPLDDPLSCWFDGWCGLSEIPKAIVIGPHGNVVLWPHDEITFTDIPEEPQE